MLGIEEIHVQQGVLVVERDLARQHLADEFEPIARPETGIAAILDPKRTPVQIDPWPRRAHLLGLPLIYIVRPESRAVLDSIELGPTLSTAVAAGRAVVALRVDGDTSRAAELPWSLLNVLRVHVLPHHLTETRTHVREVGESAGLAQRIVSQSA